MAFYLRKHFKTGPLRLNLSKGGVGLSGGVTGARIGLSPKGAYVHGGRHGLYYRKYAPKGRQEVTRAGHTTEQRYFTDTGLTYKPTFRTAERRLPDAPVLTGNYAPAMALLGIGVFMALLFFISSNSIYVVMGMALLTGGIILNGRHLKQREKAQKLRNDIETGLEERKPVADLLAVHYRNDLSGAYRKWLDFHVFGLFQDVFYEDPEYIKPKELERLENELVLAENDIKALKAEAYTDFLNELIEDHMLSREEENQLAMVQSTLRIADEDIAQEKHMISQLCAFRDAVDSPLQAIEANIRLKRNEVCYHQCNGRLLREKIMSQYQRNRVVYKAIGYDVDMEGKIYLTNNRLIIVERGSRSYALRRLLDVTLSLEDHTVQLTLDDRKNPLIFSMDDISGFAGKLEKTMQG